MMRTSLQRPEQNKTRRVSVQEVPAADGSDFARREKSCHIHLAHRLFDGRNVAVGVGGQ